MIDETEFMRKIIDANKNGNLAIFVGAGISKSSETDSCKAMDWNELIERIKNEIKETKETDFLKIAQYFYNFEGKEKYYEILENYFASNPKPSRVHEWIFNINPHIIITTNWDTLLEDAKEYYKQFFDVICNDKELVESKLPHKIIKMHGDFVHKNIIFKEEDYLNYQNEFPLIENYIKSVLSTHTVLFLGYSYNDVNLKLIIQWLRNNMQNKIINRPAMYIVNFQTHSNQITYFKKQGITTITLSDINNTLIDIDKYDANSRMVYTFLDKIFTGIDRIALIGTDKINNYILSRLIPFEGLHAILIDQIQSALSNCGFQFDADGKAILGFYEKLLTGDIYNHGAVREVYKLFIQEINGLCNGDKPSESVLRIINILSKSDIKGICLESDSDIKNRKQFLNFQNFLDIPSDNNILFSFDYSVNSNEETIDILLRNACAYYNQNKAKDSINCINKAICLCKTDNDYQKLFILMFNFNVLLRHLQFEPETKDEFKNIPKYNLEQRFNNLTYLQQETVRPVYDFVNFTTVYSYLYTSVNDLNKIAGQIQNIKTGGFSYSSNVNQYSGRHSNLIHFVLANGIFIEDYQEYKTINKNLVEIAILRQCQQNTATFTRIELYSCIRYFDGKELKQLLQDYYKDTANFAGKFVLNEDDKNWLINTVLENCAEQYLLSNDIFNQFGTYIEKIIFLLSLGKNTTEDANYIFTIIIKLVENGQNAISLFEAVNMYLGLQFNLFHLDIEPDMCVSFIDAILNKIVNKTVNSYEYFAIEQNKFSNIYGYLSNSKVEYANISLIEELLDKLKETDISSQIGMAKGLLLPLYFASNNTIKEKLKRYLLQIDATNEKQEYNRIPFYLSLAVYNIKQLGDDNLQELENYIGQYSNNNSFNSVLYTIDNQLDYILKSSPNERLKKVSGILKEIIKRYRSVKEMSII